MVGGQGLEAILHTEGRGGRIRHILSNFGTFPDGSPERAMEAWIMASGGDPAALDGHIRETERRTGHVRLTGRGARRRRSRRLREA